MNVEQIRKLIAEASREPWIEDPSDRLCLRDGDDNAVISCCCCGGIRRDDDKRFIRQSRTLLPLLLAIAEPAIGLMSLLGTDKCGDPESTHPYFERMLAATKALEAMK